MKLFDDGQRDLIEWVVPANKSLRSWQIAPGMTLKATMQNLVVVLDLLVEFFTGELMKHGLVAQTQSSFGSSPVFRR
jgi:hypothetical protein